MEKKSLEERIKIWFSNKYNIAFFAILIFAILIRLYYFSQTLHQPLWWDEAEYMMMAKAWAFNLDYNFVPVRPVLLSLITAGIFKFTTSEFLPRFLILLCSIFSVAGVYYLGREIYDKKIGLIASFLMSVFYLDLFFSFRILVDTPSLTFFIFSALFFYKYFKEKENKNLYIASILIAIGTLFKLTTATLLFAILLYVLFTEKFSFLKKKEYYIAALIFILILTPYIIWGYLQFHGFVITQAGAWAPPEGSKIIAGFTNAKGYLSLFPIYLSWHVLILFILGILYLLFNLILGFDMLWKTANSKLRKNLFLVLLFIFPIITPSVSLEHIEDRYIILAFPAIFLISAYFIMKIYNFIKAKNKSAGIIFLIILFVLASSFQLKSADSMIKGKLASYKEVMDAGLWLKQNSLSNEIIMTASPYQTQYYSGRKVLSFPSTKEEFEKLISENQNIKYYEISAYEKSPDWTYSYPQENNLTIAKVYSNNNQPILIIYKI